MTPNRVVFPSSVIYSPPASSICSPPLEAGLPGRAGISFIGFVMKYDLVFDSPWMNAAGTLGFALQPMTAKPWKQQGLFVTKPLSLEPRAPMHNRGCLEFPGGIPAGARSGAPAATGWNSCRRWGWCVPASPGIGHAGNGGVSCAVGWGAVARGWSGEYQKPGR